MTDPVAENQAIEEQATSYDASDPQAVNLARKKSSRRNADRLEVVRALMDLPRGREWIYNLLERCHIYTTSYVQGDSHASAFKEGERNIGNMVLSDVMVAAPERYVTMLKEAKEPK